MHKISTIYTTISSQKDAERLAKKAVESKLAACVNIVPNMTSIYQWEHVVEQSYEFMILFKTNIGHVDALVELIKAHHPYELPAIIVTHVDTTDEFFNYVSEQTV